MIRKASIYTTLLFFSLGAGWALALTPIERLGKAIYQDRSLSLNANQSCMTCHHPSAGYADPENRRKPATFPVSNGSDPTLFGGRNAPTSAYAGFSPVFHWDDQTGGYVGGLFWDGRATGATLGDPLAEQAQGPFLNPVEMAMPDAAAVVNGVQQSVYVSLFMKVFPGSDFTDVSGTFANIARAIAAYERSQAVTKFNSRFDRFWFACREAGLDASLVGVGIEPAEAPQGILTPRELRGLALFNDKANCATCHSTATIIRQDGKETPPLFTDFSFDNLGIPTNARVYELAGGSPPDLGLGGRSDINDPAEYGKFKVPTLRNVAHTAPYGHNGYFTTLEDIVHFYNTRDVASWSEPEVTQNVNTADLGNLGLTGLEERQLVDFLKTLTDR
jgi:cytochrome c peroxidase